MKISLKKIWASVGTSGLIIAALWGNLIYMNLRSDDTILAGWENYETTRFEELMATGEPILVEVYASWCPTCLLQHKAFETLVEQDNAPRIHAIRVDYEEDTDFTQKYQLLGTGMLILFENGKEKTRAAGLVTAEKIAGFLSDY